MANNAEEGDEGDEDGHHPVDGNGEPTGRRQRQTERGAVHILEEETFHFFLDYLILMGVLFVAAIEHKKR